MPTTPNMGMDLPTVGGSSGAWGTKLNDALLNKVDLHDHSSGLGVKVTPTGLNIDADLTFAGYGITNLGKAAFAAVTALVAGSKTLFVSSSDNELYWRTNGGTNVKLTNGNALNVSAFVGGIGGDYTAVSAAFNYDDSNVRYTAKQGGGSTWARIASGELRIYETGTSESVYVGLAAPAALGASYTITLPTAAPGSTQLLQMSSGGVVTASNTVANAVTFSGAVVASTTLGVTGASTLTGAVAAQSTLTATGLITATTGVTCAANQHVTVSGTGSFKHGTKSVALPLTANSLCNVAAGSVNVTGGAAGISLANNSIVYFALPPLATHERLVGVTVYFNSAADRNNCSGVLYQTSAADPATTTFTSTLAALTSSGTALLRATGLILQPSASQTYWVQISNSVSTPKLQAIVMDYDVP